MTATVVTSENLAEFNASRTPDAVIAQPEVMAADSAELEQGNGEADQGNASAENDAEPDEKPLSNKVEKRFGELTKQREEAKRELAREREARIQLEERIKGLEGRNQPQQQTENKPAAEGKPDPAKYTDAFDYASDLAEWSANQALTARDRKEVEQKQAKAAEEVTNTWKERQEAFRAATPDYDDVIASAGDIKVSNQIRDAILESDLGPQLLHHLASNPDIAEALASKSPSSALLALGRIEASLSTPDAPVKAAKPVAKTSSAPAPISPIKGVTGAVDAKVSSDGEFQGTFAEWKALRAAGKIN